MDLNSQTCVATDSSEARASKPRASQSNRAPQGWTPAERVVIDLDLPHVAIAQALKERDDPAIWREFARARDQDGFLYYLAQLAGTYTTKQTLFRDPSRTTDSHHTLIAIPFLLPATCSPVAPPTTANRADGSTLMGELQEWAGLGYRARLVLGCVKYVDLARWSPVTQQDYLRLLADEGTGISTAGDGAGGHVPDGVVQLAFAIGSVRCWNMLPQLPGASDAADWELRVRMAACLSYMNHCHVPPEHVLPPAPLVESVLAGLHLWLRELAAQQVVSRWDVRLGLKDLVYQELTCADDQLGTIVLPVRRHQVGPDGLSALTSDLQARFPAPLLNEGATARMSVQVVN